MTKSHPQHQIGW